MANSGGRPDQRDGLDMATLARVGNLTNRWRDGGTGNARDLPRFIGAHLDYITPNSPTRILGMVVHPRPDSYSIVLNAGLIGSPIEGLVIAHEVAHIAIGLGQVAFCRSDDDDSGETHAWVGAVQLLLDGRDMDSVPAILRADGLSAVKLDGVLISIKAAVRVLRGREHGDPALALAAIHSGVRQLSSAAAAYC